MYIEPNTTIYLLRNIPMDNSYRDSLYFENATAQINYFTSKIALTFNNQSYQRKGRGYIRLQCDTANKMSIAYGCNYLMFKNTSFENKWFYAFITSVEYINNAVLEIQYEIDILQTWYFDYTMDECYIIREHVPDDTIGLHTLPENLDTGGYYVCNAEKYLIDMTQTTALVFSTYQVVEQGETHVAGQILGGIYQGCFVYPFPMHDFTNDGTTMTKDESVSCMNNFLDYLTNKNQVESITAIVLVPDAIVPSYTATYTQGVGGAYAIQGVTWSDAPREYTKSTQEQGEATGVSRPATINDYVPRNNKIFTFPYCCLYVHNTLGDGQTYRWECFNNNRGVGIFRIETQLTPNPECILLPYGYKGQTLNFDESIPLSEFPMLSFNYDAFKAWIASGGLARDIINLGSTTGNSLIGASFASEERALQAGVGAGMNIATGVANTIADVVIHSIQPNVLKGNQQGSTMIANELLGYKALSITVRREVAIYIDNYFTRFGYNVCARKVPNKHNRTRYTYIQTDKATLSGSIPVNDANRICAIYDSGITWWADHDNVGNYSYTNATL